MEEISLGSSGVDPSGRRRTSRAGCVSRAQVRGGAALGGDRRTDDALHGRHASRGGRALSTDFPRGGCAVRRGACVRCAGGGFGAGWRAGFGPWFGGWVRGRLAGWVRVVVRGVRGLGSAAVAADLRPVRGGSWAGGRGAIAAFARLVKVVLPGPARAFATRRGTRGATLRFCRRQGVQSLLVRTSVRTRVEQSSDTREERFAARVPGCGFAGRTSGRTVARLPRPPGGGQRTRRQLSAGCGVGKRHTRPTSPMRLPPHRARRRSTEETGTRGGDVP
jgi:hypothetical protein